MNDELSAWPGSRAEAPSSTSTTLLEKVKAGEPDAWSRLSKLYGPVVYVWSRRAGLQAADAADIVQQVFTKVATHIDDFRRDAQGGTFGGWLRTITRNAVCDHLRQCRRRPNAFGGTDAQVQFSEMPDVEGLDLEELSTDDASNRLIVHRALELVQNDVRPGTWQAFQLTVLQGRPTAEVAAELGMTSRQSAKPNGACFRG